MSGISEQGHRWWIRYVFVPLIVAIVGGGGLIAIWSMLSENESSIPAPTEDGSKNEPKWVGVKGTWTFSNDVVLGEGDVGFNKAYRAEQDFDDLTYEVDLRKVSNNDGPIGLMIRYNDTSDAGYLLLLWPHGGYQFSSLVGENRSAIAGESSNIIKGVNEWNAVKIRAIGPDIEIYINGTKVESLTDYAFSSGKVGVVVHGDPAQKAEFKDFSLKEH